MINDPIPQAGPPVHVASQFNSSLLSSLDMSAGFYAGSDDSVIWFDKERTRSTLNWKRVESDSLHELTGAVACFQ